MIDNLELLSTILSTCRSLKIDNSFDSNNKDLTSPHDPLAMYRNLTNCLSEPYSYPSAILVKMETAALSIWLLIEKTLTSLNNWNISLAKVTESFQTYRSSNVSPFFIFNFIYDLINQIIPVSSTSPVSPIWSSSRVPPVSLIHTVFPVSPLFFVLSVSPIPPVSLASPNYS